jgi:thiamine-phosphate pyrophosphorylase
VGQDDLAVDEVRTAVATQVLVGLSTHTPDQLAAALGRQGPGRPDYVAIGPVFSTVTKDTGYDARGLDRVREASETAGRMGVPLVAIGGITLETAPLVLEAGASSVAVISDLVCTPDPSARVRAYVERLTV